MPKNEYRTIFFLADRQAVGQRNISQITGCPANSGKNAPPANRPIIALVRTDCKKNNTKIQ